MIVFKKRLIFWLIKAYIKKWGKVILFFFFLGLIVFFILLFSLQYLASQFIFTKRDKIGVVGAYTIDTLPDYILHNISRGLTTVGGDGIPKPDLAANWNIHDNGTTYIFTLRPHIFFTDKTPLTTKEINLPFSGVTTQKPDNTTIIFHLKDTYAPFLITTSHALFKNGFVGIGDYVLTSVKLNGNFVTSIELKSIKNPNYIKIYQFYPTQDALKVAFGLGEISTAEGLSDVTIQHTSFTKFPNVVIKKNTDYSQLVTIFYNTQDKNLSDKRLREALSYALPDTFMNGEKAYSSLSPFSFAYQRDNVHEQDFEHAKLLLQATGIFSDPSKKPTFVITTLTKYKKIAEIVLNSWKKIGTTGKIEVVETIPSSFQIYFGDFHLPKDPDQYTLWHSYQENNITNYKNLRIDKLLEDGRKTLDQDKRIKIYADFQKYLLDDPPASFLYFPYVYTVSRK